MKNLILSAVAALGLTVGSIGCNKSPEGGTPGTDNSFKVSGPSNAIPTAVKPGEKRTIDLNVERGKAFAHDVKFSVDDAPKDLKVDFTKKTLAKSDADTKVGLMLEVDKDAALAEHTINVKATPADGGTATTVAVKVKVEK